MKRILFWILVIAAILLWISHSTSGPQRSADSGSRSDDESTSRVDSPQRSTFDSDPCTSDCSGHEAGYNWAESKGISDEDDCEQAGETSNSPSFAAGCKAYVRGDSQDEESSGDSDNSTDDDPDN